jgi:hypothetical protein
MVNPRLPGGAGVGVSKLKSQAGEVLKVLHRLKARPGDCVQFVTLAGTASPKRTWRGRS